MGSGFFQSSDVPYADMPLSTLIAGGYFKSDEGKLKDFHLTNQTGDTASEERIATRAYKGVVKGSAETFTDGETWTIADFGMMRETAKRITSNEYTPASKTVKQLVSLDEDGLDIAYPKGPFVVAAEAAGSVLGNVATEYAETGPTAHPFPGTPGSEPTVVAADMVDLLLNNTEIWGSGNVDTLANFLGQSDYFDDILTDISEEAIAFQEISVPSPAFDWASFDWSAPETTVSGGSVTGAGEVSSTFASPTEWLGDVSADTITDPETVTVEDKIDDAVSAFTTLNDLRSVQDETNLRASLFSTRQMMSSTFDNALAILTANKNAQVTEYDKGLRTKQTELKVQAGMAHQSNLLQKRSTAAQLSMDAAKVNTERFFNRYELLLKAAEVQVQADIAYEGHKSSEGIAEAQITLEANKASVASGIQAKELALNWVNSKYQTMTAAQKARLDAQISRVRVKTDILKIIYDTVISWMTARAHLMTNAGPLASVITSAAELNAKVFLASREHEMAWRRDSVQTAINYSSGIEGIAKLKWNALTQNLELYRTTINALTGIPGGTHKASAFENITNVASLGSGLISTGINLGMVLS